MQAETALKLIDKKLRKALKRIDEHDTRHTRLFLANRALKRETDE